jgi:hypothetical protein
MRGWNGEVREKDALFDKFTCTIRSSYVVKFNRQVPVVQSFRMIGSRVQSGIHAHSFNVI